jgi:hypothetical protein
MVLNTLMSSCQRVLNIQRTQLPKGNDWLLGTV